MTSTIKTRMEPSRTKKDAIFRYANPGWTNRTPQPASSPVMPEVKAAAIPKAFTFMEMGTNRTKWVSVISKMPIAKLWKCSISINPVSERGCMNFSSLPAK